MPRSRAGVRCAAQQMLELRRVADPEGVPLNIALAAVYAELGLAPPCGRGARRGQRRPARGIRDERDGRAIRIRRAHRRPVQRSIDARREEIVELTRELDSLSDGEPAGRGLSALRGIHRRAARSGAASRVEYVRAEGTPGDERAVSAHQRDRAARERAGRDPACTSTAISTWCRPAPAGPWIRLPASMRDGQALRPRRLRHEGRTRGCDRRRRGADRFGLPAAGRARDLGHRRRGIGRLRRRALSGRARLVFAAARRSRHHSRAVERGSRLHRSSRRVVGGDRDSWTHRARLDAVSGRLRRAPHERRARPLRSGALPKLAARKTDMPVVPSGARHSTLNINSIHGGLAEMRGGALPSPCVPDSCRMVHRPPAGSSKRTWTASRAKCEELLEQLVQERAGFSYSLRDIFEVKPTMADRNGPVARAHGRRRPPRHRPRCASSFARRGPTIRSTSTASAGCAIASPTGPGILDLAHQPDEYVLIDDLVASAKVMALAAASLLSRSA